MKLNENVRGLRMIRQMIVALSFTSVAVFAGAVADNQNTIEQKVDSINAKRGVSIGGSIRAMHTGSRFSSDQDLDGINKFSDHERTEFVNADFDFTFRPWEFVRANATLRFEAGMQDYFAGATKNISVPWLNVEGNIGTNFYWVIGNFREQYTPLTLFAPDLEIMYEPMVFARGRHMAKKQELLEGNQRNLQGANLQFRASPNDAFGEIRAEAIFARLRRVQELDFSGEVGNILPNDLISGSSQASNMDKWLLSGNLEWFPLSRNLLVGATGMWVFDDKSSFTYTYRHQGGDLNQPYIREPINPFDTLPQNTKIASARLGADVAGVMGNKNLILDLVGEFAMSFDEIYSQKEVLDSLGAPAMTAVSEDQNGKAILVNLNAGYKTDNAWGILLKGDFVSNDSAWFNNLAQSPQFFARRILNTDIDGNTIKYGVNSALYSTFDALYHFTPKYSPPATSLGTNDAMTATGQTGSYNIAPITKSSYTSSVYTRDELALINSLADPALQMVLPNGLATSNRLGGRANLIFNWSDFAEVQGLFSMFNEVKALAGFDKAQYMEFGGGAKLDIFKMLGFSLPLELSGSYKRTTRSMDDLSDQTSKFTADFINGGIYVRYLPRLGLTAGFQMIDMKLDYSDLLTTAQVLSVPGYSVPLMKGKQMQWMVGLDYTFAENAWFSINYGIISVENTYNTSTIVAGAAAGEDPSMTNLPIYYDVTADTDGSFKHQFSQSVIEASINVEF